jgi:organic radical activating enzyme
MKHNVNPFNEPKKYRDIILKNNLIPFPKKQFSGKSLACLFLTRFCSVGCPFCFYKSAPAWRKRNIEDQFSDEGVDKFIEFSKSANLGYLLISGGGEPLNQRKHILEIVKKVEVDRIVLVTSGNWAKHFHAALNYIDAIYQAMKEREKPATVVLRLSVSVGHNAKMGLDPAKNLIKIFRDKFSFEDNFLLQIKTFEDDPTLGKVLNEIEGFEIDEKLETLESDNNILIKKIPKKYKITFKEGLNVNVGVSKIFHSTLQADLNDKKFVDCSTKVFEEDISDAEDNNPAVVFNPSGDDGIDWSINYNGDICTWQNQVRDNYLNLYEDSYEDIFSANFNDPVTYSFIDKGRNYR